MIMSSLDPNGAKNVTSLVGAGLDLERTRIQAASEIQAARIRAQQSGTEIDFNKKMTLLERINRSIAQFSNDKTPEEWDAQDESTKTILSMAGGGPRTAARQAALDALKAQQKLLEQTIFPESAAKLHEAEEKADAAAKAAGKVTADETKLEQLMREKPPVGAAQSIFDLFNQPYPNGGGFY